MAAFCPFHNFDHSITWWDIFESTWRVHTSQQVCEGRGDFLLQPHLCPQSARLTHLFISIPPIKFEFCSWWRGMAKLACFYLTMYDTQTPTTDWVRKRDICEFHLLQQLESNWLITNSLNLQHSLTLSLPLLHPPSSIPWLKRGEGKVWDGGGHVALESGRKIWGWS